MELRPASSKKQVTKKKVGAKFAANLIAADDKKRILAAFEKSRNITHELQQARCIDSGRLYDQVTM